jgi:hypothetical protein
MVLWCCPLYKIIVDLHPQLCYSDSTESNGHANMIYILKSKGRIWPSSATEGTARKWADVESRNDWKTFAAAEEIARGLTETTCKLYIATDAGSSTSPRYDVIKAPAVGDEVSYSFNSDTYPCGTITRISKTMKRVSTTSGRVFYRRDLTGSWINAGIWSLVQGHITTRNPHF